MGVSIRDRIKNALYTVDGLVLGFYILDAASIWLLLLTVIITVIIVSEI